MFSSAIASARSLVTRYLCHRQTFIVLVLISLVSLLVCSGHVTLGGLTFWRGRAGIRECSPEMIQQMRDIQQPNLSYSAINPPGDFTQRLAAYNDEITSIRKKIITSTGKLSEARAPVAYREKTTTVCSISEYKDDFLQKVNGSAAASVVLLWDTTNTDANTLLTEYYSWSASQPLCDWIREKGDRNHIPNNIMFNHTCITDKSVSVTSHGAQPITFNRRPIKKGLYWPTPQGYYTTKHYSKYPDYILFLNIFTDAYVTGIGDVITAPGVWIRPATCWTERFPPRGRGIHGDIPAHQEVFVISQFWGSSFFHRMLEVLPRIAPYVRFLRENRDVMVHVPDVDDNIRFVFKVLGLSASRAVSGVMKAGIIYLPQGTPCGTPLTLPTQLLSAFYRNFTHNHLANHDNHLFRDTAPTVRDKSNRVNKQNATLLPSQIEQSEDVNKDVNADRSKVVYSDKKKVVYIQRSGSRKPEQEAEIIHYLQESAPKYDLEFHIYPDDPVPDVTTTLRLYGQAAMVVAPHGAGESNLIFSPPGCVLIELVCNLPHVNMCYQREAEVLGIRYHAIPSLKGCETYIDVDLEEVKSVVTFYLNMIKEKWNAPVG